MIFDKPLHELEKSDIEHLCENKVKENRALEYKRDIPGGRDQDKVECLADITSFANASGGYIIYGLGDKKDDEGKNTGTPEYVGLREVNFDQVQQRINSILLRGVDPRIKVQYKEIGGFANGPVIVIYIPRSFASPHMVKINDQQRFYSRDSSGKYQLDIDEIRAAFVQSEALPQQMRNFRLQRIEKIIEGDTPVYLMKGLKYVLHIIPFNAFMAGTLHDLSPFVFPGKEELPVVAHGGTFSPKTRYNLYGVVAAHGVSYEWKEKTYVYTQLFRNGVFEAVWMPYNPNIEGNIEKNICVGYEVSVVSSIKEFLIKQEALDVAPPICIMVSLLETKGSRLSQQTPYNREIIMESFPIKEERILLPEVILESFEENVLEKMKPVFGIVWNAAGISRANEEK